MGRALLGKSIGDTVTVSWHAGLRELTVAEIDYSLSEAADATASFVSSKATA